MEYQTFISCKYKNATNNTKIAKLSYLSSCIWGFLKCCRFHRSHRRLKHTIAATMTTFRRCPLVTLSLKIKVQILFFGLCMVFIIVVIIIIVSSFVSWQVVLSSSSRLSALSSPSSSSSIYLWQRQHCNFLFYFYIIYNLFTFYI